MTIAPGRQNQTRPSGINRPIRPVPPIIRSSTLVCGSAGISPIARNPITFDKHPCIIDTRQLRHLATPQQPRLTDEHSPIV